MICPKCGEEYSTTVLILHLNRCNVKKDNIEGLEWHELKKRANEKGIKTYKKSKEEIIKSLKELEG